jgi:hypothetical protein
MEADFQVLQHRVAVTHAVRALVAECRLELNGSSQGTKSMRKSDWSGT